MIQSVSIKSQVTYLVTRKEIMNRELKGFMAKFEIKNKNLASELGLSENTVGIKIREEKFSQSEIKKLIKYFKSYDSQADSSIFFEN